MKKKPPQPDDSPYWRAMEAARYLKGYQVLKDFLSAGLLAPCAVKQPSGGRGRGKGRSMVFYDKGRVEWCANEVLAGRYPSKGGEPQKKAGSK